LPIRNLERLPLRTAYPAQIDYRRRLLQRPPLAAARPRRGVAGRQGARGLAAQAALRDGALKVAPTLAEARTLVGELYDFRANISEAGHTSFGAREGAHVDLVLAVGLGLW
jgi:hypothetical protein